MFCGCPYRLVFGPPPPVGVPDGGCGVIIALIAPRAPSDIGARFLLGPDGGGVLLDCTRRDAPRICKNRRGSTC